MKRLTHIEFEEAAKIIRAKTDYVPSVALILGSGLGELANKVKEPVLISFIFLKQQFLGMQGD